MRKAVLLIAVLLGGCAAHSSIRPLRPLEIAMAPYQQIDTASFTGSLMYEGNCLLFRDEISGALMLPIWPVGSSFNGTAVLFHEPAKADQRIMIAEQFVMQGHAEQWSALASEPYASFQRQCGMQPFLVTEVRPAN